MRGKRDVVRRLQADQSLRSIQQETGMHRVTIRRIRDVARNQGWLDAGRDLPDESEIATVLEGEQPAPEAHPLHYVRDKIERWVKDDMSYTVIHRNRPLNPTWA